MGTFTAQILVGRSHPYDGGIIPSHYLFLSENGRSAWILLPQNISIFREGRFRERRRGIVWIPTPENMLEDALLMIAIHVCRNQEVIDIAKRFYPEIDRLSRLELCSEIERSGLEQLYQKCREVVAFPKLAVSVFSSSSIQSKLSVLEKYNMEVEVCVLVYNRWYSCMAKKMYVEGSLAVDRYFTSSREEDKPVG